MKPDIELNYLAISFRKMFKEDEYSYIDIFAIAKQIESLTIVMYPFSERISGMCIKQEDSNVIAINSTMSYGRQRFSLAHELYHLYYCENVGTTISSTSYDENNNEIENDANTFASYLLAPYNSLKDKLNEIYSIDDIALIKLEHYFGISNQALLRRLLKENAITEKEYAKLSKINISKISSQLGYDNSLYLPSSQDKLCTTFGNYIIQANRLKDSELITKNKYHELLLDAFREDLVYSKTNIEAKND